MEADKTDAAYARKSQSCCNPAQPPPHRTPRSAWRTPPSCLEHPDANPGSRARTPQPSLNPDTDLHQRLLRCAPNEHLARCPPSEKTSTECRWLKLRTPPHETPSRPMPDPMWRPFPAESGTLSGIHESRRARTAAEYAIATSRPQCAGTR